MFPRNDLLVVSNHICPHGLSLCCIFGFFRNIYGLLQGYRWDKTLDIEPEEIQEKENGENDAIYTKVHFQLSIYGTLGN